MVFTNRFASFFTAIFIAIATVLVAGCATSPSSKTVEDVRPEEIPDAIIDENFVPIPNPYLQQKVNVPADLAAGFEQGVNWMQGESWPQAEMQFSELTTAYPSFSGPWVNLGICQWRQDKIEPAAAAFERAIAANSLNVDAYNTYAVMLREQGDFAKAESLYKQAIQVWPHSPNSHRNLGVLYDMYMGRFDEALYHFEVAAKVTEGGDKTLRGWIVDIKRRQAKAERDAPVNPVPEDGQSEVSPQASEGG